jgi:superfamily I DNA/RNA helicase
VAVLEQASAKAEAVAVGKIIEAQVGGAGFLAIDAGKVDPAAGADRSFGDFAVLFRTLRQAETFAEIFARAGIPFQMASRQRQLDQVGAAELLALYRLLHDTGTSRDLATAAAALSPALDKPLVNAVLDWKERRGLSLSQALQEADRIPAEALTAAQRERLKSFIRGLAELRRAIRGQPPAAQLALMDQLTAVRALPRLAADYGDTLACLLQLASDGPLDSGTFMARLALLRDADTLQEGVEKVALLTMHAAKGLEFPVVFITGCEDGLVPFVRTAGEAADLEEERRLFYVAMTRARERLYLSWSRRRTIHGQPREQVLSPFVAEIESRLLAHQSLDPGRRQRSRQVQLKLF